PEFIVYAGVPRTGIYRSDDGGVTWNLSNTGLQLVDNIDQNGNGTRDEAGEDIAVSQRIELAIHDNLTNNTSAVYAGLIVNGSLLTVYRTNTLSPNPNWVALTPPTSTEGGTVTGLHNPTSPQGNTHFSLAADPNSSFDFYVGGDRQPVIGSGNSAGLNDWVGRIFEGDFTPLATNPGNTVWKQVVGNGASGTAPHADSRDMTFNTNGVLIEVDDGGIAALLN